jgi:hypothetical protein
MSGKPMETLKTGALQIGEAILSMEKDMWPFEKFITLAYNDVIKKHIPENLEDYSRFI